MDILEEIKQQQIRVDKNVSSLKNTGQKFAQAERDYKIAVNKKALELKDGGMPVTLIQLVIYGYPEIARLRFERDSAEVLYNANQEALNVAKLQLRILQGQYEREWNNIDG